MLKLLEKLGLSQTCSNTESERFLSTVRDRPAKAENDATSFASVSNNLVAIVLSFSISPTLQQLNQYETYKFAKNEDAKFAKEEVSGWRRSGLVKVVSKLSLRPFATTLRSLRLPSLPELRENAKCAKNEDAKFAKEEVFGCVDYCRIHGLEVALCGLCGNFAVFAFTFFCLTLETA